MDKAFWIGGMNMDSIIIAVLSSVAVGMVGWVGGRFSIKTKTQDQVAKLEIKVRRHEEAIPLILECHLVQLIALQRGHINGECDEALDKLNHYLINK